MVRERSLESIKTGDQDGMVVSMPCPLLAPNFSELGLSAADCVLYYGKEPTDGSKFHYLFADIAAQKTGYFDDNGDFVEIEVSF